MSLGLLVIGLNHSSAPVHIRERITFPGDSEGETTAIIASVEGVEESMILSTCNRAEIIAMTSDPSDTCERLIRTIGLIHEIDPDPVRGHLYVKHDEEAVRHVFRVASSLDSMVLGEPQILGQVKEGYRRATGVNATGPILNRLMHRAFFTAKRVRTETGVALAAVSVAYVAVELAGKIIGELQDKTVLLIGAGEMAELAAKHLTNQVEKPIVVINRTFSSACALAGHLGGLAMEMERLEEGLISADVVISSTGSCEPLIGTGLMKTVMRRRRYRPIFLIDIAIPRDIEPQVNDIDGVYVYNIDDLQSVVEENLGERRQEALRAETIISDEVAKFMAWTRNLESAPTIVALREKLEAIRSAELSRCNGKLSRMGAAERETVEMITRSIINKIAHDPISFLKRSDSRSRQNMYLDIAQRMFKLDGLIPTADDGEEESLEK